MGRFLLYFSYIGSRFGGMQRQGLKTELPSVQGTLEEAIQKLRSLNSNPQMSTSSRTDKGVHALMNTGHVDLVHLQEGREYDPEFITTQMNRHIRSNGHDLVVTKVRRVPDDFHARHSARGRSYLYRLAVVDSDLIWTRIPVAELRRCYFVRSPFCETLFREAANMMCGVHDFGTFMSAVEAEDRLRLSTIRDMDVRVSRSKGLLADYDDQYGGTVFYDLEFNARSFLYNQIRRMTAAMVAVAIGRLSLQDLQQLFDNPGIEQWPGIALAPPDGLYLRRVEYCEKDLIYQPHTAAGNEQLASDVIAQNLNSSAGKGNEA